MDFSHGSNALCQSIDLFCWSQFCRETNETNREETPRNPKRLREENEDQPVLKRDPTEETPLRPSSASGARRLGGPQPVGRSSGADGEPLGAAGHVTTSDQANVFSTCVRPIQHVVPCGLDRMQQKELSSHWGQDTKSYQVLALLRSPPRKSCSTACQLDRYVRYFSM